MAKTVFAVLVTTRGFFNPDLAKVGTKKLIDRLTSFGHEVIVLHPEMTPSGAVETYDDAEKWAKLALINKDNIDGIIVTAPNFGDEVATVSALNIAKLDIPILVHAFDDRIDQMDLQQRRDSFCGKLSICANLNQYKIKFTNTQLHTCDIDSKEFEQDIDFFSRVCKTVRALKGARIAQIGTRPSAFQTVRFSEKLLQSSGITVIPVDLSDIISQARNQKDADEISRKISYIRAYGRVPANVPIENVKKSAQLLLAVEKFMNAEKCSAGAFQCWDSIQKNFGCAACLPMSIINENGRPMACETDITGAVSMLALASASGTPSAYMDWNNNYNEDREKCVLIHCANYPKSFFGCEFEISNLDILGKSLGFEKCFGACKARVRAGELTFAKITTDELTGKIRSYVGEGRFTDDPIDTAGSPAVAYVRNLQTLMHYICKEGFEHHVATSKSLVAKVIEESLANYLGWEVYLHH